MAHGDWLTLAVAAAIIPFTVFHLTKRWTRPTTATIEIVNAWGWGAILALAVYAILSIHRG
jgi:hypothetical protein